MGAKSRVVTAIIVVGLVILIGAGAYLWHARSGTDKSTAPTAPSQSSAGPASGSAPLTGSTSNPTPFDAARATAMSEAISSGTPERLRSVIAVDDASVLDPGAPSSLSALAPITFDVPTVRYVDESAAYIQAYVGRDRAPWVVYLLRQNDEWKISATQVGTVG